MKHVPVFNTGASAGASAELSSPASTESVIGFGDKFKKPEGAWDCDVCLVPNKAVDVQCVACQSAKPGTNVEPRGNKIHNNCLIIILFKILGKNRKVLITDGSSVWGLES